MIATVFLAVLVLALLIGNALLFFIPKRQKPILKENLERAANIPETQDLSGINPAVKALVAEERISLLNRRIARLEELGSKPSLNIATQAESELAKKILDLQEFKRQARLEIEALKQRIGSLREELKLEPDNMKKRVEIEIPEEKLHALVYRR
ncbi:MAG: hypothetical protein PHH08_04590 [Candidatus ainarchaeum sp.]|nr:hypothetical protein [Candidatus ainarchaeum sp.]